MVVNKARFHNVENESNFSWLPNSPFFHGFQSPLFDYKL